LRLESLEAGHVGIERAAAAYVHGDFAFVAFFEKNQVDIAGLGCG
jgi:hypothetical protein